MNKGLIGYTGFVGTNLQLQTSYDRLYNSKNIEDIRGEKFAELVISGAPAEKWKANQQPEADRAAVQSLIRNLQDVQAERAILISTVDVYRIPRGVNEHTVIDQEQLEPYGKHRYELEQFVQSHFPQTHIVRLPGLFGQGLKKNIIYDLLHDNNVDMIHCDGVFQFYNLGRLQQDLLTIIEHDVRVAVLATEPVSVREVARHAFDLEFANVTDRTPASYDLRTVHASLFGGGHPEYIMGKEEVLEQIRRFVQSQQAAKQAQS